MLCGAARPRAITLRTAPYSIIRSVNGPLCSVNGPYGLIRQVNTNLSKISETDDR